MAKRKVVSNSEEIVPIPMPIDIDDAKTMGFSKKDMIYRRIGRKVYSCILVPGTRQQQADWLREFDNERKAEDREQRCLIADGKGGFITCPGSNSCARCPKMQKDNFDTFRPLSLELLQESPSEDGNGFDPPASANVEDDACAYVMLKGLIDYLRTFEEEPYARILMMLFREATTTEIARELDLPWSTADYKVKKTRKLAQEFTGLDS